MVYDRGATSTGTTTAIISDTKPTSEFVATPQTGASPLVVIFVDESTSYDGIASWDWAFGDGGHSTTTNPTHTFTTVSTYTVTLTVYEDDGDS